MATNDFDLDIDNYNYVEMLELYDVKKEKFDATKMDRHLKQIRQKYPQEVHLFFLKIYKILEHIYHICQTKQIEIKTRNLDEISDYISKILHVPHFEEKTSIRLLELLDTQASKRDVLPIVQSYNNPLSSGSINSIKRMTQTTYLNLNSCFRTNYYASSSTDFFYTLPSKISNVVSMRLSSIELQPNCWYSFSAARKNNNFQIEAIDSNHDSVFIDVIIPDGNYTADTLTNFLNNTYFYKSSSIGAFPFIEFFIDGITGKTMFRMIHGYNITSFSLYFTYGLTDQNLMERAGWILGFRLATYLEIIDHVQSEALYDNDLSRYIYFSVNDFQYNKNNLNIVGFDQSSMEENILTKIPFSQCNGVYLDQYSFKMRKYNGPINLSRIQVKILDKFGKTVDLNYMDFSFTLELETLYESTHFENIRG
jgi:hypothetical protein